MASTFKYVFEQMNFYHLNSSSLLLRRIGVGIVRVGAQELRGVPPERDTRRGGEFKSPILEIWVIVSPDSAVQVGNEVHETQ